MDKHTIALAAYDPDWAHQFEALKNVYVLYLKDSIKGIEHVGSTAVPYLVAKPVLDIDLIIASEAKLQEVIEVLATLGYEFRGNQGIKDRYAFRANGSTTPNIGTDRIWPKHHLYCCIENSASLNNHITLRDALRNDPKLREAYGQLKKELASRTNDIDVYIEGKSDFIANILLQNGFTATEVDDIFNQNLKKT